MIHMPSDELELTNIVFRRVYSKKIAARVKEYTIKHIDSVKAYRKEYRTKNADAIKLNKHIYGIVNKEKISIRKKTYRAENHQKILDSDAKRRKRDKDKRNQLFKDIYDKKVAQGYRKRRDPVTGKQTWVFVGIPK